MTDRSPRLSEAEQRAGEDPRTKLPPGPGLPRQQVVAHQTARIEAALVEMVAERGYEGLKVRELVKVAGVSTRAFYEHFASKEDCFLRVYAQLSGRATRRIFGTQAGERDWQRRLRLVLAEFAQGLARDPAASHLVLIDVYDASPMALEQADRAERLFETMLVEGLARSPGGIIVPLLVIEGVVAGIAYVARSRLRAGRVEEVDEKVEDLMRWALTYPGVEARQLEELDRQSVWRNTMLAPLPEASGNGGVGVRRPTGDRALILSAVAKLTVANGYASLTAPRIRAAAGVSRRKFDAHFDGVEDCYIAAFEQRAAEALAQAARAQAAGSSWAGGVYRAIAALCEYISGDAFLASVCRTDELEPGSRGSKSRQRLILAVAEQLSDAVPADSRPTPLIAEALSGAVWGVFHRHLIRDWVPRRQIAATLSYLALAPIVGASAAVAAIAAEQTA